MNNQVNQAAYSMTNFFKSTIQPIYEGASRFTMGCGGICALVAAEFALHAFKDLANYFRGSLDTDGTLENFSWNVGGSVFLGLCAANVLPGTPIIGAALFTIYSLGYQSAENYATCTLLRKSITLLTKHVLEPFVEHILEPFAKHILTPIYNHLIVPLANAISLFVRSLFSFIAEILPNNDAWRGVTALGTIFVIVKFALPALGYPILR